MARTEAQKKAVAEFQKKLEKSKEHIASGGSPYGWDRKATSSKPIVKDPSTGKTWESVEEYVKDPKKYGGGTRTFQQEFDKQQAAKIAETARKEAERKIQEAKLFAEKTRLAKELVERQKLIIEKKRIDNLRKKLQSQNAQETSRIYTNSKTKDKVRHDTLINRRTNERIFMTTNLRTGKVSIRTYELPRGGGSVRQTGGYTQGVQRNTMADILEIKKGLYPGDKLLYNPQTMRITGIQSARLNQSIPWTEKEVDYYNAQISKVKPGFDFKEYAEELKRAESETEQSIKENKAQKIIKDYTSQIANIESSLKDSANSGEITRLAELQRKRNRTAEEEAEKKRLEKSVANNYKLVSKMIGLTVALSVVSLGVGGLALANKLRTDPINTIRTLPASVWTGIKQDYARARGGSLGALNVAVEYATLVGVLKGVGYVGGNTIRTVSKVNPKFVKIVNGKVVLRKTPSEIFKVGGTVKYLEKRVLPPSIKRPFSSVADFLTGRKAGQFKKFTKDPGLILKTQTVASGAKSLSAQAKLAGKEVTAVNASVQQLTSWLGRKKLIRKPIPGEANFPPRIIALLKKFDSGKKLTTREFAETNIWLQKNVAPNITLLERSLYLDPASGLRISRLGIKKTQYATLKDILKGNFRLWNTAGKPQVLIFENAKIAKFPKSLKSIEQKIKADKTLTTAETNKLIAWQIKTGSGQFKPIGSTIYNLGKELEVTLAPGEMIKRIKRVGFTYIEGKKVNFVTAEIFKPTKQILAQIKKANLGKLTNTQLTNLEKSLSNKLGRKVRIETPKTKKLSRKDLRRADQNIPVLRVRSHGIFVLRRGVARTTPRRVTPRKGRPVTPRGGRAATPRKTIRAIPKRPGRPVTPRKGRPVTPRKTIRAIPKRPGRPSPKPIKKPPIIPFIPKDFTQKKLSKAQPTYYVVEKVRGKLKKLYPKPLTAKDAKDYAVHSIDNHLSKTAFFIPLGKSRNVVKPPKNIQGYYSRNSHKVRSYRIKFGKKKQMVNGFIEKRAYAFDRPLEKKQLRVARMKARRKISPIQRKIMLRNLAIARKIRMKKLKNTRIKVNRRRK